MKQWFNNKFPEYRQLSRSGKCLAWITLLQGISWIGVAVIIHLIQLNDFFSFVVVLVVGLLNLYSSYFIFQCQLKGFRWAILVFILALLEIRHKSGFFIDLSGVLKLSVGMSTSDWFIGLNFAAILFLWLIYKNIMSLKTEIDRKNADIPIN